MEGRKYCSVNDLPDDLFVNYPIHVVVKENTPIERLDSLLYMSWQLIVHVDSFIFLLSGAHREFMDYYCSGNGITLPSVDETEYVPDEKELIEWESSFVEMYKKEYCWVSVVSDQLFLNGEKIEAEFLKDTIRTQVDKLVIVDMTQNNKTSDLVAIYRILMDAVGVNSLKELFGKKQVRLFMPFDKIILQSITEKHVEK